MRTAAIREPLCSYETVSSGGSGLAHSFTCGERQSARTNNQTKRGIVGDSNQFGEFAAGLGTTLGSAAKPVEVCPPLGLAGLGRANPSRIIKDKR
jgi:hypothetical protein